MDEVAAHLAADGLQRSLATVGERELDRLPAPGTGRAGGGTGDPGGARRAAELVRSGEQAPAAARRRLAGVRRGGRAGGDGLGRGDGRRMSATAMTVNDDEAR
jgi:hypothetical protein